MKREVFGKMSAELRGIGLRIKIGWGHGAESRIVALKQVVFADMQERLAGARHRVEKRWP